MAALGTSIQTDEQLLMDLEAPGTKGGVGGSGKARAAGDLAEMNLARVAMAVRARLEHKLLLQEVQEVLSLYERELAC